jgi:NAD(P)H-nitrite reductase large subunit
MPIEDPWRKNGRFHDKEALGRGEHPNIVSRYIGGDTAMTRFIIVGGGSAGTRAAETIRSLRSDDAVTLISEEKKPFYMRPLLADFVGGRLGDSDLWTGFEVTASSKNITVLSGREVVGMDYRHDRRVVLDNGERLPYDVLLIASGIKPHLPQIPGADLEGVTTFYSYADAVKVKAWAEAAKVAVVIGRGLPALELTRALRKRGIEVTLLVPDDTAWLLPLFDMQQEEIEKILSQHEVNVVTLDAPIAIESAGGGRKVVKTREGRQIPADIVGIASDQKASLSFLAGTDIPVEHGVMVDARLRTADERVFAAGDVVQLQFQTYHRVLGYGWVRAGSQGEAAARNMCGEPVTVAPGDEFVAESLYGASLTARWR